MLACGTVMQPLEIRSEVQGFQTSACPARVTTDCGDGYIKGVNNPCGPDALISELIAAELGTWFGLKIPNFAIVRNCEIDIKMTNRERAFLGFIEAPVFFSSAVEGEARDGGSTYLKRLQNPADVAKLVVFDTWIRNIDRHDPRVMPASENSDNLLYISGSKQLKYDLAPIDHSMCLFEGAFQDVSDVESFINDEYVYGFFPEFKDYIDSKSLVLALNRLNTLDKNFVSTCLDSVPTEWGMSVEVRNNLELLVCNRAKFVVSTISGKIVDNPQFDF